MIIMMMIIMITMMVIVIMIPLISLELLTTFNIGCKEKFNAIGILFPNDTSKFNNLNVSENTLIFGMALILLF